MFEGCSIRTLDYQLIFFNYWKSNISKMRFENLNQCIWTNYIIQVETIFYIILYFSDLYNINFCI